MKFELAKPDLARWREGNTGIAGVWRFDSGTSGPEALITALVHGNEVCGAATLVELLEAGVRPTRGALTLAFCNLDAFDRFDPAEPDGWRCVEEDFNRVWGTGLHQRPGGTLERRRALELAPFVERADRLLDLHSMHDVGEPLLLAGPHPRNVVFASSLGLGESIVVDSGHADGVRMRDHGRLGAPGSEGALAVLIECGWHGAARSRAVALEACRRFLGGGEPHPPGPVLEVTHAIVAASMDTRFAQPWRSGERIAQAGTVLGWRDGVPFVTPYEDCVLVMPSLRQLRPGVTVMRLARQRSGALPG